jgi:hypothetical protein
LGAAIHLATVTVALCANKKKTIKAEDHFHWNVGGLLVGEEGVTPCFITMDLDGSARPSWQLDSSASHSYFSAHMGNEIRRDKFSRICTLGPF